MTRAYETTNDRYVELADRHNDSACDEHAHCPCGGLMSYGPTGMLVCADCGADALAEPKSWEPAEVDR